MTLNNITRDEIEEYLDVIDALDNPKQDENDEKNDENDKFAILALEKKINRKDNNDSK